ncbi:MAG: hypothetical protein JWO69_549 [Thermoleophilia bacterium]|jgi:phage shock protein A|nr:hypothetical protein [Thermoleophilia bacterium]
MNVTGLADGIGNLIRGGQGKHNLSEEAVVALMGARRGIAPSAELTSALAKQGAIFDGSVGEVIKNAPEGGGLLDALRKRVGESMFSLMDAWKDRNFPIRLEKALQQQEEILPKLREAMTQQQRAVTSGTEAIAKFKEQIGMLTGKAEEAVKGGDDGLAAKFLAQKLDLQQQVQGLETKIGKYVKDLKYSKDQIQLLSTKIEIDKTKGEVLIAEWKLKRDMSELSDVAKNALDDLNKLEGDALKNARQAEQATKEAQREIDDLISGGGIRLPNGGSGSSPVDDAVKQELDKLKDKLGSAA